MYSSGASVDSEAPLYFRCPRSSSLQRRNETSRAPTSLGMLVAEKLAALRTFFGLSAEMPLPQATLAMHEMMGIVGTGPLPAQIDNLIAITGVLLTYGSGSSTDQGEAVGSSGVPAPSQPSNVSGKKRKQSASHLTGPRTISGMLGKKVLITGDELRKQRKAAGRGVDYSPREFNVETFEVREQCSPALAKEFYCSMCPRSFSLELSLINHTRAHSESANSKELFVALESQQPPRLPAFATELIPTTASTVQVSILIGGRTCKQRVSNAVPELPPTKLQPTEL